MNNKSRTKNLQLNIIVGFAAQFLIILLSFVGRRLFVSFLSVDYLGINGLYTNILSVLSLAELGLGSVVSFSLYKPVSDDNQPMIIALIRFYKKIYWIIAGIITLVGLSLIPLLKYIVTSDLPESELIIYYLLFLASTVSTYFVAHKVALLGAYQENRVQKYIALGTAILQQIIHIVILVLYPNYIVYVASTIVCTLISNIALSRITSRKFRYLSQKDVLTITIDKNAIKTNVKATGIYKLSTVLINSTDNILISVIISTTAVGIYSNYCVVVGALQTFISIVTSSLINSVGNLNTENNKTWMLEIFRVLVFAYHFVACYCGITLFFVFNDFVEIWLGSDYLLSGVEVFAISANFYLTNLLTPVWGFREATGQFYKAKYIMLTCALVNVALSIVLGISFGIFGILIATAVSKLLTVVWYEPKILFNNVFQAKQNTYWMQQGKLCVCTALCIVLCGLISQLFANDMIGIIVRCVLFFVVTVLVFVVVNIKSDEFVYLKGRLLHRSKNTNS